MPRFIGRTSGFSRLGNRTFLPAAAASAVVSGAFGAKTNPSVGTITGLAAGNSLVMLTDDGGNVWTSVNQGTSWTVRTGVGGANAGWLLFNNGIWLIVTNGGSGGQRSADNGVTWAPIANFNNGAANNFRAAGNGGSRIIAFGQAGGLNGVSNDNGLTFGAGTALPSLHGFGVDFLPTPPFFAGGNFNYGGRNGAGTQLELVTTTDATAWVETAWPGAPGSPMMLAGVGGNYVGVVFSGTGQYTTAASLAGMAAAGTLTVNGGGVVANASFLFYNPGAATFMLFDNLGPVVWQNAAPASANAWLSVNCILTPSFACYDTAGGKVVIANGSQVASQ